MPQESVLIGLLSAGVGAFFTYLANRDKINAGTSTATMQRLWERVEALERGKEDLGRQLDECREHHRECQSSAELQQREIVSLRADLDDLRRTVCQT